jgi:hypothetical protein
VWRSKKKRKRKEKRRRKISLHKKRSPLPAKYSRIVNRLECSVEAIEEKSKKKRAEKNLSSLSTTVPYRQNMLVFCPDCSPTLGPQKKA